MSKKKVYYPSWRYHETLGEKIVQNEAEDKALGKGWVDSPAKFGQEEAGDKGPSKKGSKTTAPPTRPPAPPEDEEEPGELDEGESEGDDPEEEDDAPGPTDFEKMSVKDLKKLCVQSGIDAKGTKKQLIERLKG